MPYPKTKDGYEVAVGDVVWTKKNNVWRQHTVASILPSHKVLFEEPDVDGYEGAKLSVVYMVPKMI